MPDAPPEPGPAILETQLAAPPPSWAAPPAPQAEGARFTVGGALSRTMRAWWAHVGAFTGMSLVAYAPMVVAFALFFGWVTGARPGRPAPQAPELVTASVGFGAAVLATMVLSIVQVGAVTYATIRYLHGERASLGRMLGVGLRRALPVVGTGLVQSILAAVGFLLLVVPGIMFLVASCAAVPAAVVERPGVTGALKRSFDLTRGFRWPLFATGGVVIVVVWILSLVTQAAFTVAALALPPAQQMTATLVASQVGNLLFSAIPGVAVAVCYHDLRRAKEGVDTAELARVFE